MIKRIGVVLLLATAATQVMAHSPQVDSVLTDWCVGAFSNTAPGGGRVEDRGVSLSCGKCSGSANPDRACRLNSDCPAGQTCINIGSKTEIAWWDNRTDGAVNDLATVAMTYDNTNLYIAAELWVDPDPVSLPFGMIALDYTQGGLSTWHDPNNVLVAPGHCSQFTDRACTSNDDCHFCMLSTEPFPSTRVRPCGSACDPGIGDVCQVNQTCVGLGEGGLRHNIGQYANPEGKADYLLLFDFSLWLSGLGDAVLLVRPGASGWQPVTGCAPDFPGDTTECDFPPRVNPGQSGGSGGPPGSVEVAIPWSAFGCTGCPGACVCPGMGPNVPFRFTMTVVRGNGFTYDFAPDGAHEDVMSESVGGGSTTSTDNCAGFGIGNTTCELSDRNTDAFIPKVALNSEVPPGGRINGLLASKTALGDVRLSWNPSCSTADIAYEVYEGVVGTWNSHVPVPGQCMVNALNVTFTPGAGDRYYLVVPTNGPFEGSYGTNSAGAERPASAAACVLQVLGTCP